MDEFLTSADVARLLGVGPTSVKRWADSGLLPCLRTPGKHRRFARDEVERFRLRQREVHAPDPAQIDAWLRLIGEDCGPYEVHSALLFDRSRLGSWWQVAELIAAVLTEMGDRWRRGELSVLQEHAASERLSRGLARCVESLAVSPNAPRCLLATAEGDEHTLGLLLAELSLREHGWNSQWAGRMAPTDELIQRIEAGGCDMLALSAAENSIDAEKLRNQALSLGGACQAQGVHLVLGGRGLWPEPAPHLPPFSRVRDFREFHELLARGHV
jgi:excisionase family DNA binding protein